MAFLNKKQQDYLNNLFKDHLLGQKYVIPIGLQILELGKCETKISKTKSPYISVDIIKKSDKPYRSIKEFYWVDYSSTKLNPYGIPYGVIGLQTFLKKAFNYELLYTEKENIDLLLLQLKKLKESQFKVIIRHLLKLHYKDNKLVFNERTKLPEIIYEPRIDKYSMLDDKQFGLEVNYLRLIDDLIPDEKEIYNKHVTKLKS